MTLPRRRSGFALALAVCMLAAIGSLAGASFYAVREARRTSTRLARQEEAASSADARLFELLSYWSGAGRDSLSVGSTDSSNGIGGDHYVTRLTERVYTVTAVGRAGVGTSVAARRAHSILVDVVRPTLVAPAAIVSRGNVVMAADAGLSGQDGNPPGWDSCPPADSVVAPTVLVPEGSAVRDPAGQPIPSARVDPIAGDTSTYRVFGRATAKFLAERADVVVRGGAMLAPRPAEGDKCQSGSDIASWGEPFRGTESPRCERYFPVVHAEGDIVVTAGRGQGLLLVDGRLRIEGPFVFYGVIVAQGGIEVSSTLVSVYGAVRSGGAGGLRWLATGAVRRSTCAVARAVAAASRPSVVGVRGWSELF